MRRPLCLLLICWALAACAGAPAVQEMAPAAPWTGEAAPQEPPASAPTSEDPDGLATEFEFFLLYTPEATETALPPLVLPPLAEDLPAIQVWDGRPTYLAESQPGFFFRVRYDPAAWARTRDWLGTAVLAHRSIPACVLSPSTGRGLPLNAVVEHETRSLGGVRFEVNTVFVNGKQQFMTFVGGDGSIVTGFELSFQEDPQECLGQAEAVLATLVSIPGFEATVVP